MIAPLVICGDDGQYSVCEDSLDWLREQRVPLGILACAGKFRTGKSYLMNRVANASHGKGFGVGDTVQACTKGIWIRKEILKGDSCNYVCIDTEGIDALDADNTHDVRIFTLGLLLSSVFIYNSVGPIDESSLQTLALMTNISKCVKVTSEKDATIDELSAYFPHFMWILRDFSLKLTDKSGKDLTTEQYLSESLSEADTKQERCKIRATINSAFNKKTLFTLPRPASDEYLHQLDNKPKAVNSLFNSKIADVKNFISANMVPMQANGVQMTGAMYAKFVVHLVNGIGEDSQIPVIKDAWSLMSEVRAIDSKYRTENEIGAFAAAMRRDYRENLTRPLIGTNGFRSRLEAEIAAKMRAFDEEQLEPQAAVREQLSLSLVGKVEIELAGFAVELDQIISSEADIMDDKLSTQGASLVDVLQSSFKAALTEKDPDVMRMWKERVLDELLGRWLGRDVEQRDLAIQQMENNIHRQGCVIQTGLYAQDEGRRELDSYKSTVEQEKVQLRQEIDHLHDRLKQSQGDSAEVSRQLIEKEAELELLRVEEKEARACIDTINEQLQNATGDAQCRASGEPSSTEMDAANACVGKLGEEITSLTEEVRELMEIRSNLLLKLQESRTFEKEQTDTWISQIEAIRQENAAKFSQLRQKTSEEVSMCKLELQGTKSELQRATVEKHVIQSAHAAIEIKLEETITHTNRELQNVRNSEETQRNACTELQDKIIKMHKTLLDDARLQDDKNREEHGKRYREIVDANTKCTHATSQLEQSRGENESLKRKVDAFEDNERELKKMRVIDSENKQRLVQAQTELRDSRIIKDEVVKEREDMRNALMESERKLAISTRELQIERARVAHD